jgi:hypothetical protein
MVVAKEKNPVVHVHLGVNLIEEVKPENRETDLSLKKNKKFIV